MQTLYTKKVNRIDKKHFHRTDYARIFNIKFDTDLLHNKIQFDTTYYPMKTLIEFNNLLSYYQLSDDKTKKAIEILEECKKHINSKYEKCYDKHCIDIYEYLMSCYNEIEESKKLGKKPNWNAFVNSITPYIKDLNDANFLYVDILPKTKEIKETNCFYQLIEKNILDKEDLHYQIEDIYYKLFNKKLTEKEFIYIYDLLTLICNIYDLLYNNDKNKHLDFFLQTNASKDFFKFVKSNALGKQFIDNYIKSLDDYCSTSLNMIKAFFDEYITPSSTNSEFIDSYNMLKIIPNYIKENNIYVAKLIIKELLRKHKDFLVEVHYEEN